MLYNPQTGAKDPVVDDPKVFNPEYKSSIVDSVYTNQTSLLSNVTGTPVRTNYYRQHAGKSEEQIGLQLEGSAVYQSYAKIHNLIMKFDGKPAFQFDPEKAQSTEEGVAWVIADLSPKLGDMFTRDIGDGRGGLYQLTQQPELRSYAADKVYLITFKLIDYLTEAIESDLESKVVKHYYYSKDSVLSGGNALITAENYDLTRNLLASVPVLVNRLYQVGYFNPEETIVLNPESGVLIYDESLVRFLARVIPVNAIGRLKPIHVINLQVGVNFGYNTTQTVYDALMTGNEQLLRSCNNKQYKYSRNQLVTTRRYANPSFTKLTHYIVDNQIKYNGMGLDVDYGVDYVINDVEPTEEVTGYFSDGFFNGSPANEFERLTYEFCFKNVRDRAGLFDYISKFHELSDRDVVYQTGVLVMMIMVSRRVLIGD